MSMIEHKYFCQSCELKFRSTEAQCPECNSKWVAIDEPIIRVPKSPLPKLLPQVDKYTLYGTRLLVFLEDAPQSNEYRQICVNEKQFKAVSDAVCAVQSREGDDELVMIQMSEETYKLPDLQEIYDTPITNEDNLK